MGQKSTMFEGGPLNGQSFVLPTGTIEIVVAGPTPEHDHYKVVVHDDGVVALWVGGIPTKTTKPEDVARR